MTDLLEIIEYRFTKTQEEKAARKKQRRRVRKVIRQTVTAVNVVSSTILTRFEERLSRKGKELLAALCAKETVESLLNFLATLNARRIHKNRVSTICSRAASITTLVSKELSEKWLTQRDSKLKWRQRVQRVVKYTQSFTDSVCNEIILLYEQKQHLREAKHT